MKEKPMIFSTPIAQAILEGRKTMTRRVIKPRYRNEESSFEVNTRITTGERSISIIDDEGRTTRDYEPPYSIGDIIWVRESFSYCNIIGFHFKTDKDNPNCKTCYKPCPNWKSPRYMPKEAARIFLEVTEVRVERLQDIPQEDILKEGIISDIDDFGYEHFYNLTKPTFSERGEYHFCTHTKKDNYISIGYKTPQEAFINLWDKINKKRGFPWEDNLWVWVIEFKRIVK